MPAALLGPDVLGDARTCADVRPAVNAVAPKLGAQDGRVLYLTPESDIALSDITGKTVAARGWIERRNGPMIDIRDPSQLEIQDAARPAAPALPPPIANGPAEQPAPENGGASNAGAAAPSEPAKQNHPAVPDRKPPGDVDL